MTDESKLMVECSGAHDRCYGGLGAPCPWCEPVWPLRYEDGKFASPAKAFGLADPTPARVDAGSVKEQH